MKLILRSDLAGLGKRGDIVEVSDGYGRNYLLPRKLALVATDGAVDQAARMRRARDLRDAHDREVGHHHRLGPGAQGHRDRRQGGSRRSLFGSVTAADVAAAVAAQTGIELDRKQLEVDPIKTLGQHTATAELHADVSFPITRRRRRCRLNGPSTGLWVRGTTAMSPAWAPLGCGS